MCTKHIKRLDNGRAAAGRYSVPYSQGLRVKESVQCLQLKPTMSALFTPHNASNTKSQSYKTALSSRDKLHCTMD